MHNTKKSLMTSAVVIVAVVVGSMSAAYSAPQKFKLTEPAGATIERGEDGSFALMIDGKPIAELSSEQLAILRSLDEKLGTSRKANEKSLAVTLLEVLATSGDGQATLYVQEVFETQPQRRADAAYAISRYALTKRRQLQDFRFLLRSLSVVEGKQARSVLLALAKYRQLGTKAVWKRQVILLGLQLGDDGGQAAAALLKHWTRRRVSKPSDSAAVAMAAWQAWFKKTYPDQPEAVLPVDSKESKWKYQQLRDHLDAVDLAKIDVKAGEKVFEKALCFKCHRYGQKGEKMGPDLSTTSVRRTRKENLESILFPSHVIHEEYPTTTVVTVDGKTYSGIMAGMGTDAFVILQLDGKKQVVKRDDIEEIVPNKKSAMPDGLLKTLTLDEITALFGYISRPPEGQ